MTDEEAHDCFCSLRWVDTDGKPVCPACGCCETYSITTRKQFKCKACFRQFSVTSGTIFSNRKLPIRDYLLAIAIFVNGAKGYAALQLSRDLDCQYKSAFVMAQKSAKPLAQPSPKALPSKVTLKLMAVTSAVTTAPLTAKKTVLTVA